MNKDEIRKANIQLRKTLNQKAASLIVVSKILKLDMFLKAKNVLIFYPMQNEINLLELLKKEDKNFYLPKVEGDELIICPYSNNLKESDFKVMEPCTDKIKDISIIDVAFIPCVAIDKNLNRIGYGKGFYDRLFSKEEFRAVKIAVINKELLTDEIDIDCFDKKVDFCITD